MKEIISKELLSEVFGCDISDSMDKVGITRIIGVEDADDGTFLTFGYQSYEASRKHYINIYELAHKCKEWAALKKFWILSSLNSCEVHDIRVQGVQNKVEIFRSNNELSVIAQACQWILDNKDNQC